MSTLSAIVLAGGASRRMGQSKALLSFEGEAMLTRVVRRARAFASEVIVVAQAGQELPPCEGARVVADPIASAGPLVGLMTGLREVKEEWAFVCTTDAPFVSGSVALRMVELGDGWDAVVPDVGEKKHVLTCVYRRSLVTLAEALVEKGVRRASTLSEKAKTRFVTREELLAPDDVRAEDPELDTLMNVNTPEDLGKLLARRAGA